MRVLIVLGSGGHSAQMIKLSESLGPDFEYVYLVGLDDKLSARKIVIPGKIYFVNRARKHKDNLIVTSAKVLRLVIESFIAFIRIKPDAVISAGPGMAVPISAICKIFGRKVIFIEDWSRVYQKSKSGRIIYYFADLFFVQWPEMKKIYPKSIYAGRLG